MSEAVPIRPGDTLDAASLTVWLHEHAPELLGASHAPLRLSQFTGGFSNLTYLVRLADRQFVLRRPPPGVAAGSAHDMSREYRMLRALAGTDIPVPEPIAFCDDTSVLGAPFYLMSYVDGVVLRELPPAGGLFDARTAAVLARVTIGQLAALHALDARFLDVRALDVRAPGLERSVPEPYVARQIRGWTRRWDTAQTSEVPTMTSLAAWLQAQQPADAGEAVIHNDFKYDNLVLDPATLTTVRAILDWEMATVGCPLMDLGTTLAYWMEPDDPPLLRTLGLGITAAPGSPSRAEVVTLYEEASGCSVPNAVFYYVFGLFKLAVVAQQLFARHLRGLSNDPRFARLDAAVGALAERGVGAIEAGRI